MIFRCQCWDGSDCYQQEQNPNTPAKHSQPSSDYRPHTPSHHWDFSAWYWKMIPSHQRKNTAHDPRSDASASKFAWIVFITLNQAISWLPLIFWMCSHWDWKMNMGCRLPLGSLSYFFSGCWGWETLPWTLRYLLPLIPFPRSPTSHQRCSQGHWLRFACWGRFCFRNCWGTDIYRPGCAASKQYHGCGLFVCWVVFRHRDSAKISIFF